MMVFHINRNDKSAHILKNEAMFRTMGIDVQDVYDHDLLNGDLTGYDAIYLNWFENIDGGAFYMPVLRFIRRKIQLARIRRSKIQVIYCKHNKFPHNARYPSLSRDLYLELCRMAKVIIAFNNDTDNDLKEIFPAEDFSKKIRVIPPLHYIGTYPPNPGSETYQLAKDHPGKFIVGFVGKISSYKNVELIIRAAAEMKDEDIVFMIFGQAVTQEYEKHLDSMAKGMNNVIIHFGMVPDDEMYPILDISDILIMPYDVRSASNSGTGRLAFSYGKTVISPDISSMKLIPEDLIYEYHYDNDQEHYGKMAAQIYRAYHDWQKDPGILAGKGARLLELMRKYHSEGSIRTAYQAVFDSIV